MALRIDGSVNPKSVEQLITKPEGLANKASQEMLAHTEKKNGSTNDKQVGKEELNQAISSLHQAAAFIDKGLEFNIHEDTNRLMVKVIDRKSDEVIREIPPEQILDMVARIRDMIGLLLDKRG